MTKWFRQNGGGSLIEVPVAIIVVTLLVLGACVVYLYSAVFDGHSSSVAAVKHADAEAVDDLTQSGVLLQPITRALGPANAAACEPTESKDGR